MRTFRRGSHLVATAVLVTTFLHPAQPARAAEPETTPLDMIIAVDESGSLQPADLKEEIKAATAIATSGLNPKSRITVIGFGSDNGATGQRPTTEVCRPTVADTQVRQDYLRDCTRRLHSRTDAEGNDTDHLAALSQALQTLRTPGSPDKALKVVFLLTDGVMDVEDSPRYGRDKNRRTEAAMSRLPAQFNLAVADRVQIWPLGFGQADKAALDRFAAGGSQEGCDQRPDSKPRARVVSSPKDVLRSLTEAYAAATCSGLSDTDSTTLESGKSSTLSVDIPVIATDGKITVSKGDPKVRVDYLDPAGNPVPANGKVGDTEVARSGENSTIETLGLVNPANGIWKIKLTAPAQLAKQLVSATAIWQGAVQASLVPEPPSARTGQAMIVRLSLLTRKGAVTDEKALAGLNFAVVAESTAGQQNIVVRDDGKDPDDKAHDGSYAGTVTAPATAGDFILTGVVSGKGLRAEKLPVTVSVSTEAQAVQGRVTFDNPARINPGDTVKGTVTMENGGAPLTARLVLDGPQQTRASIPDPDFAIPQGTSKKTFTVAFGADAALGGTSLKVKVAEVADLGKVHANGPLTLTLVPEPTLWDKIREYLVAAGIVLALILAALLERRRRRRRAVDVSALVAVLNRDGQSIAPLLKAPRAWSPEFRFIIDDVGPDAPQFAYPTKTDRTVYVARRGSLGKVDVRTPQGDKLTVSVGTPGAEVVKSTGETSDWTLAFRDQRRTSGPVPPLAPPVDPVRSEDREDPRPSTPTPDTDPMGDWL